MKPSPKLQRHWSHSSVGQSVWLITIRSPVQALGPFAVVVEERRNEERKCRRRGSCFQLWFAAKSGVHVRYSRAGQDTRLSSE